jgi:hypothetical protein
MGQMASAEQLEELAFNAWPSLQTVYVDGWIARFSQGYMLTDSASCRKTVAETPTGYRVGFDGRYRHIFRTKSIFLPPANRRICPVSTGHVLSITYTMR